MNLINWPNRRTSIRRYAAILCKLKEKTEEVECGIDRPGGSGTIILSNVAEEGWGTRDWMIPQSGVRFFSSVQSELGVEFSDYSKIRDMEVKKWMDWKTIFGLSIMMGVFLSVTKPNVGDLNIAFRLVLILGGIVGYCVVLNKERREKGKAASSESPLVITQPPPNERKPSAIRYVVALCIVAAVLVGMLILARLTSPE